MAGAFFCTRLALPVGRRYFERQLGYGKRKGAPLHSQKSVARQARSSRGHFSGSVRIALSFGFGVVGHLYLLLGLLLLMDNGAW